MKSFDEAGNLTHEPTVQFLDTVVENFVNWYNQISKTIVHN